MGGKRMTDNTTGNTAKQRKARQEAELTLVAAVADNGVIGENGKMPWHLPEDLAHFREITLGKTVLMGRKTWLSLPDRCRPLVGRRNLVLSRNSDFSPLGAECFGSLQQVLEDDGVLQGGLWVIGGGSVYANTMPLATALEITEVHRVVNGDSYFPSIRGRYWQEVRRVSQVGKNGIAFSFVRYERLSTLPQTC